MILAFVSCKYRFNWHLSREKLKKMNNFRENKNFSDEQATIDKNGKAEKKSLDEIEIQCLSIKCHGTRK